LAQSEKKGLSIQREIFLLEKIKSSIELIWSFIL
jgi:hypothetical protein